MAYVIQKDQSGTILHVVRSVIGTGTVTGKAATITYSLRDESGNLATTGLTITEQSTTGYYNIAVTPDAVGNWQLSVTNPSGTDEATYDYPIQCVLSAAGHAPSGTFLTTLANIKEQLGIVGTSTTFPDAYLNNVIARASHTIERLCGRALVSASYTEYVDGDGTKFLNLRRGPFPTTAGVTSVSSITYSSTASETATAVATGDYFLRGVLTDGWYLKSYLESNGGTWSTGQRNYKVVYTAGFSTVPYDLEQACLSLAVAYINRRKNEGTSSRDVSSGAMAFIAHGEMYDSLRSSVAGFLDSRFA